MEFDPTGLERAANAVKELDSSGEDSVMACVSERVAPCLSFPVPFSPCQRGPGFGQASGDYDPVQAQGRNQGELLSW